MGFGVSRVKCTGHPTYTPSSAKLPRLMQPCFFPQTLSCVALSLPRILSLVQSCPFPRIPRCATPCCAAPTPCDPSAICWTGPAVLCTVHCSVQSRKPLSNQTAALTCHPKCAVGPSSSGDLGRVSIALGSCSLLVLLLFIWCFLCLSQCCSESCHCCGAAATLRLCALSLLGNPVHHVEQSLKCVWLQSLQLQHLQL